MSAINLTELFSTRVFRIPDYQRGYSWGEKQWVELWDDIDEIQFENGEFKKHYTGTVYLEKSNPENAEQWLNSSFFNVVDGQQRLTTICVLLFELLNRTELGYAEKKRDKLIETFIYESNISGESRVYKFNYSELNQSRPFLLSAIFEDENVIHSSQNLNHYQNNLLSAKEFFQNKLKNLDFADLEVLFVKLTTALQFDLRFIEKDLDVQAVFETMNNRGKPLSTLEKLKNRLIYLTEKLDTPTEDKRKLRGIINDGWGQIYTHLAINSSAILPEDEFLSAHLSLYRRPTESTFSENTAEVKVFQMFCNKPEKYDLDETGGKEPPISYLKIKEYVVKIAQLAPIWSEIHHSKNQWVRRILTLDSRKEVKMFLAVLFLNYKQEEEQVQTVLSRIEQILFRNKIPGIWLMDERTFANWSRELYAKEIDIDAIVAIQNEIINTPIVNSKLIQSFNSLFAYERGAKGYHRWSGLKYFLFEYEVWLMKKAKEVDEKISILEFMDTTIEHVIPQQYQEHWRKEVDAFTEELVEDEQEQARKVLINSLGNLTLLKHGKNSSLGNRNWKSKQERFETGSYNEIFISREPKWGQEEILRRGLEMLGFLQRKVQGLELNKNEMMELLFSKPSLMNQMERYFE